MKLKKIASLMLAGVMAVSMLAGCNTAAVDPEQPEQPEQPTTSAAAEALRSELTGSAREKVTAVADAELDTALDNAVAKYWNYGAGDVFQDEIDEVNYKGVVDYRDTRLGAAVKSAVGADFFSIKDGLTGDKGYDDSVNRKAVEIWAVPADVRDDEALEIVAEKIDPFVTILPLEGDDYQDDYVDEVEETPNYNYSYTISASIETKTVTFAGLEYGVKYVAVMVTKTVAEKG